MENSDPAITAIAVLLLIAAAIALHALFLLLFRPGRRKAAAIRLAVAVIGVPVVVVVFLAVTVEVPEITPERAAEIQAERERREQAEADRIAEERLEEERAAAAEEAAEEAECLEDFQCWGDRYNLAAAFACEEPVERMAQYSAEWTDGVLEPKFPRFRRSPVGNGVIVYIGDAIRFQNGFGAWTNMVYECTYDPATDTVLDVTVREGWLP